jgi:hypothetical protein
MGSRGQTDFRQELAPEAYDNYRRRVPMLVLLGLK